MLRDRLAIWGVTDQALKVFGGALKAVAILAKEGGLRHGVAPPFEGSGAAGGRRERAERAEGAGPAALVDDRAALFERRQRKGVDAPRSACC